MTTASLRLAPVAPGRGQEQVLRELLRDRRAAADDPALLPVLLQRVADAFPVEAAMLGKLRVLGRDHRALQLNRDPRVGNPAILQRGLRILRARLVQPLGHECGLARRLVAVPADVRADPCEPEQRDGEERGDPQPQRAGERRLCAPPGGSAAHRGPALFAPQLIALREHPGPGDVQDVRVALDVRRERRERRRHFHDLHRGGVEHLVPGRAVDLDALDACRRCGSTR